MKRLTWIGLGLLLPACALFAVAISKQAGIRAWTAVAWASPAPPRQPRPPDVISRLQGLQGACGSWQEGYRRLHADILARALPPRYLAFQCPSGLADTLRTAARLLFVAAISKRALVIDMPCDNRLEWAFKQPNINWSLPFDPNPILEGPGLPHNRSLFLDNTYGAELAQLIAAEDLSAFGGGAEVVYMRFYGYTEPLLADNIHHAADIYQMGLTPDSMFACAMDFLFELQPAVLDLFQHEISMLTTTTALRVGIQIRTGDWAFHPEKDNYTMAQYQQFFDCAEEVAKTRSRPGQEHLYYLISDSHHLRMDALRTLGNKTLLTNTATRLGHIAKSGAVNATGFVPPDEALQNKQQQMLAAAGEIYLFGLADVYIYSMSSGFGAWGAARARKWHNHYIVETHATAQPRKCGLGDYDKEIYKLNWTRDFAYLDAEWHYNKELEQHAQAHQQGHDTKG